LSLSTLTLVQLSIIEVVPLALFKTVPKSRNNLKQQDTCQSQGFRIFQGLTPWGNILVSNQLEAIVLYRLCTLLQHHEDKKSLIVTYVLQKGVPFLGCQWISSPGIRQPYQELFNDARLENSNIRSCVRNKLTSESFFLRLSTGTILATLELRTGLPNICAGGLR